MPPASGWLAVSASARAMPQASSVVFVHKLGSTSRCARPHDGPGASHVWVGAPACSQCETRGCGRTRPRLGCARCRPPNCSRSLRTPPRR
eukprot:9126519-Pyramimonas_sp.AAC.1